MGDLRDRRWIVAKGGLFVLLGLGASSLLLVEARSLWAAFLFLIAVWAFCRAYYFAFYVIEHYVDPTYRFDGLWAFARYCVRGQAAPHEINAELRGLEAGKPSLPAGSRPRWKRLLIAVLVPPTLYAAAVAVGQWPRNTDFREPENGIAVAIVADAAHSEIVLPVATDDFDWRDYLGTDADFERPADATHVAIGWGDEGFYMHTPTWAELRLDRAVAAAFWPTATVMRVTFRGPPAPGPYESVFKISPESLARLTSAAADEFDLGDSLEPIPLTAGSYADCYRSYRDRGHEVEFYRARGTYTALYTCNTWTSDRLAGIGVTTARWTPLTAGVLQVPKP